MCEELERAIEIQESLGKKLPKQMGVFVKGTLAALKKQDADIKALATLVKKNHEERDQKLQTITDDIKDMKEDMSAFRADATKWQLIIGVAERLFGDTKRSLITLIYIGVLFGLVHISDIIEVAKALV